MYYFIKQIIDPGTSSLYKPIDKRLGKYNTTYMSKYFH